MVAGLTVNQVASASGGSTPSPPTIYWDVAQKVEQCPDKAEVRSSILRIPTNLPVYHSILVTVADLYSRD